MAKHIRTTHVGSLPRSARLTDLLIRHELGDVIDSGELEHQIARGVHEVLRHQVESGVDIVSDGEQSKPGFQTYVAQRMTGFGGESKRRVTNDVIKFPAWAEMMKTRIGRRAKVTNAPQAVGDVRYHGEREALADCDRLRRELGEIGGGRGAFMTAPSPGIIATTLLNAHYDSHERYLFTLAEEMRKEYDIIHKAGFILQVDAPDLAMERTVFFQDNSDSEFVGFVEMHVEAINRATANIPPSAMRVHCCWGNREGPHVDDIPLATILPKLLQLKAQMLSIELANPRHQHEYESIRTGKWPADKTLIPGVIDSTTNYVEPAQVVANRILQAVAAVEDPARVIAGVDCGFGTFAGYEMVASDVVWAKLKALREGADLAARSL
jgi:5-methyltetrahydropteroyltriglutamate--homocysteine methyltransferase